MNLRSRWALLVMALTALLLSPAAQAQHMHGFHGSQFGGNGMGAPHFSRGSGHISGFAHNGFAPQGFHHHGFPARGFHHHRAFTRFVVIGGTGFWYPYPYPYDASAMPAYSVPPPAPVWYYCPAAGAYYPYVTSCAGGWQVVPATPDQAYPVPQQ